jgi:hypothetical protein
MDMPDVWQSIRSVSACADHLIATLGDHFDSVAGGSNGTSGAAVRPDRQLLRTTGTASPAKQMTYILKLAG